MCNGATLFEPPSPPSEVAQRISKAIRFGLTEVQSGQDLNNFQRIQYELNDLAGSIEFFEEKTGLNFLRIKGLIEAKKENLKIYLNYSKELGTVK